MRRFLGASLLAVAAVIPLAALADEREADRLYAEGARLSREGRAREAAELFGRTLEMRRSALGETHAKTLAAYASVGEQLRRAGEPQRAIAFLERAAEHAEKTWGRTHETRLNNLNNLALALFESGKAPEALRLQEEVVRLSSEALGETHAQTLARKINFAHMMSHVGRIADAAALLQDLWRRANAALGPAHETTLAALSGYSGQLFKLGRYEAAEKLAQQSLALTRQAHGARHPRTLARANSLGQVLIGLRRYPEAIDILQQTQAAQAETLGPGHSSTLETLNNLAGAYFESGQQARAGELYRQALAAQEAAYGAMHPTTLVFLSNVSAAAMTAGRWNEGLAMRGELISRVESLRTSGFSPDYRRALMERWVPRYREYAGLLARNGRVGEAFRIGELAKARTLLELSSARRALNAGLLQDGERAELARLEARVGALDAQSAALAGQPHRRLAVEGDKEAAVRDLAAATKALEARYPKLAELGEARAPTLPEMRDMLPAGSVYLSYVVQSNLFMVIALSAEHGASAHRPGLIANLPATLAAWRFLLAIPAEQRGKIPGLPKVWQLNDGSFHVAAAPPAAGAPETLDAEEIAAYLGEKLLGPVAPQIAGARRLIISPDADLAFIPFEALRHGGRYVIEGHEVQYTQSAGMYALSRERALEYAQIADRAEMLSVGGAIYEPYVRHSPLISVHHELLSLPSGLQPAEAVHDSGVPQAFKARKISFSNLPGTEREAKEVAGLFSGAKLLTGADASEQRLWELNRSGELRRYRHLLFATHGYVSPRDPRLSSVVLTQIGNRGPYDGYVTASEWPLYDLRSDLLVISACNSGFGPVAGGEGLLGLPFALHVAGNRNTVLSLWVLNDAVTADFVRQFFSRVRDSADHVNALTQTKRAFLAAGHHPSHWAPFVLYGS